MVSLPTKSILSPSFTDSDNIPNTKSNPLSAQFNPKKSISHKNPHKSSGLFFSSTTKSPSPQRSPLPRFATTRGSLATQALSVSQKVQSLDFEFKSLPEPIDRVKRLLHYAAILPPFDESSKNLENRVSGCTARVWLEVKMEESGDMRFWVDSDSEITKGFSSCLVWALDGARPEDVLSVKTEDLLEMNIGLSGRVRSRVNTWHNVLFSMQRKTRDLVEERSRERKCPKCLENVVVSSLVTVDRGC